MGVAAASLHEGFAAAPAAEQRAAPRFTSLIRSAKLVCGKGEFVCVVRDVSSTGVRLRCFHQVPRDPSMALELQNGELLEIELVRLAGLEASYRFVREVPIERLIGECELYPRRLLRLKLAIPVTLRTLAGPTPAVTINLSQQGCRLECGVPLAMAQPVTLEGAKLPSIRAKVRWRRDGACGLVFDDTFSLKDFALHAARLQCPGLVSV